MTAVAEKIRSKASGINSDPSIQDTVLGKCRKFSDLNKKEILFVVLSGLSILACLSLTVERIVAVDKSSPDFTFAVVLVVNIVFCSYYIATGIVYEKPYELIIFIIGVIIVCLYLIVNYAISTKGPYKLARLISACGVCPIIVVLGAQIAWNYYRSCKLIFRTVGSLENLQGMCKNMFIFFGLLQMDLQLGASVTVVVLTKGDVVSTSQLVFLCAVGFLTLSSSLLGYFGVRRESRKLMYIYAVLWISLPAYAIYSIVQTAVNQHGNTPVGQDTLGIVTYICCALSICTRAVIPYLGCKVYRSFGNGLKERVYNRDGDHQYSSLP